MKFGIVTGDIEKAKRLQEEIAKFLEDKGQEVVSDPDLADSDVVLTLGGDGTLIHMACKYTELNVPFVGINAGTLGFLTAGEIDNWREIVQAIIGGKYFVSERMTLDAKIEGTNGTKGTNGTRFRAVNEIVVKSSYRVVDLEVCVGEQKFLSISGDGVIISTQTGSTAYSLSAGGPIVDPEVDCFVITPVNAHGLPIPSVVLSAEDEIVVKINKGHDVSLIVDGQGHESVSAGQSIKVSKGDYRVKFGYLEEHHFLEALNAKFGLASRLAQ